MDGGGTPRSPEDVFRDFRARRAGMIKALTTGTCRGSSFHSRPCGGVFERFGGFLRLRSLRSVGSWVADLVTRCWVFADVEKFYQQCDPGELLRFAVLEPGIRAIRSRSRCFVPE